MTWFSELALDARAARMVLSTLTEPDDAVAGPARRRDDGGAARWRRKCRACAMSMRRSGVTASPRRSRRDRRGGLHACWCTN